MTKAKAVKPATHAKIRSEWKPGHFITVMASLTGNHFMLPGAGQPQILGSFRRTSTKERSPQNGHTMTKYVEVKTGEECWVFADGSVAE